VPHIGGRPVEIEQAYRHAARLLRKARQPLITGMAADVSGCRAALALAELCGAIVDHQHGEAAMHNLRVLQSKGWLLTTLAEVRNRADVVLLVGTNAVDQFPRFFERLVWNAESLAGVDTGARKIFYLGDPRDTSAGRSPDGRRPTVIRCGQDQVAASVGALRSLLRGVEPRQDGFMNHARIAALRRLAATLREARYGVIVWAPAELDQRHGDLVVHSLSALITDLNAATRCAGLPLGGNDGGMTCQNVTTWQSGFPLRVNYASGAPAYDPALHGTRTLIEHGATDALLWLNCFDSALEPPHGRIPVIAVARPTSALARAADVFIPVATPGLDHAGVLFRTDSVVSLPLRALRQAGLPDARTVLDNIAERV